MARPRKCRKICSIPQNTDFAPANRKCHDTIEMAVDEYEAIRLIDLQGLTQEQCAQQMQVARTTAQAIYASARKKLALCIVKGCHLKIDGGDVHFCDHRSQSCGHGCGHMGHKHATNGLHKRNYEEIK